MKRQAAGHCLALRFPEAGGILKQAFGLDVEESADLFERRHIGQRRTREILVELLTVHAERTAHGRDGAVAGAEGAQIVGEVLVGREGGVLVHRSASAMISALMPITGPAVHVPNQTGV